MTMPADRTLTENPLAPSSSRSSYRRTRITQLGAEALRVLREAKVELEGEIESGLVLDLDGLSWRKRSLNVTNNTAEDDSTIRVAKANVPLLPITPPLQAPSDSLSRNEEESVKAVFREYEDGVELSRNTSASYVAGPALLGTIESQEVIAFPTSPDTSSPGLDKEDIEATIKLPIAKRKCRPSAPALFPPSPLPAPVMGPRARRSTLSTDKPPNAYLTSLRTHANTLGGMLVPIKPEEREKYATITQR
ncbi:hypothetical protein V5O48_005661 [Marasmius crinis-equi]|uniref:Uncharacterized protein n=1 Tax=Marasmius crinis-equi TaxID=585013 RepID=A0ABR3FLM9_9AGAR